MSNNNWLDKVRSFRIAKMAVFDWICTIIGAGALAYWLEVNFFIVLLILLIVSIPLHLAFGVRTYTNYYLGIDEEPNQLI